MYRKSFKVFHEVSWELLQTSPELRPCTLGATSQAEISVCMQGSRECCLVCVRTAELFVRVSTAVRYAIKCFVTSHDTSTGLLGTFQASSIGE